MPLKICVDPVEDLGSYYSGLTLSLSGNVYLRWRYAGHCSWAT